MKHTFNTTVLTLGCLAGTLALGSKAQAALIAYEGFDGSINSSADFANWTGAAPGDEWQYGSVGAGLTFGDLVVNGGSIGGPNWSSSIRKSLASSYDLNNGPLYIAFLGNADGGGDKIFSLHGTGTLAAWLRFDSSQMFDSDFSTGLWTGVAVPNATTALHVLKVSINSGDPSLIDIARWAYTNTSAIPSVENPADAGALFYGSMSISASGFGTTVTGFGRNLGGIGSLDEVRFGTGFSDVLPISTIPEPSSFAALSGLVALGFIGSRRRRA